MSTDFIIHHRGLKQVVIVERSSLFDLGLIDYDHDDGYFDGPQQMSADEALNMAAGIIYAVCCMHPEKAEALVKSLVNQIPTTWNRICRERGNNGNT